MPQKSSRGAAVGEYTRKALSGNFLWFGQSGPNRRNWGQVALPFFVK